MASWHHPQDQLFGSGVVPVTFSPLMQYAPPGDVAPSDARGPRLHPAYGFGSGAPVLPSPATPHPASILHSPLSSPRPGGTSSFSTSLIPSNLLSNSTSSSSFIPSLLLSTSNSFNQTFALIQPPPSSSSSSSTSSSSSSFPLSPSAGASEGEDLESMLLWTLREPATIALTLMYCASFALGFAGNLMSLHVLTGRRSRRRLAGVSATRSLLVNLAVCDLAVVCVCMPVTLGNQIYRAWVYGDLLCRAVPFTQAVSVSASVLTLTVISVNRYYSVRSPLRARSLFTRRRLLATVGAVWAVSSAMCAPLAVMNRRREVSFGSFSVPVCQEEYNVVLFVALYCLPVTFNLIISFLTGRRLWVGRKSTFSDLDPRSQALHKSRLKMRQKIAKMVVCLVLLFAVSWLPLYLADLWIDREERPPSWLLQTRPFVQWLGLTNSSLNPICYCFIGDLYRSAKVIRTRYYQKVAALFTPASLDNSLAMNTTTTTTDGDLISSDHNHVAAASLASMPGLLGLARGQGLGLRLELGLGKRRGLAETFHHQHRDTDCSQDSEHSISDWYKSSPSMCSGEGSLADDLPPRVFPCPVQRGSTLLPERRHSVNEKMEALPLQAQPVQYDTLPDRRHSGDRMLHLFAHSHGGGVHAGDQNGPFFRGLQRAGVAGVAVDSEQDITDMTRL
ncbi:hypothetical protein CRUP_013803 [Coryphaenoides rupestris]|nr:hypothetical protein CRUP_013803 [Coryphaenoides rupestris]